MGRRTLAPVLLGVAALALLLAPASQATFHEIQVREVFPGSSTTGAEADYVELQMFASGQSHVKSHSLRVYDSTGKQVGTAATFLADVGKGANQSTILFATPQAEAQFGVTGDLALPAPLQPSGGAVCWENLDCVSWGAFSGTMLPSPAGTPVATAGIPDGQAIQRTIARGCATALDPADDTNDSAADFSPVMPAPRPNSVSPTEQVCGGTGSGGVGAGGEGTKGNPPGAPRTTLRGKPAKRTRDRTPTFRFSSNESGARYQCKLDAKPFRGCRSPFTAKQLAFGPHTFKVRAVDSGGKADPSPAAYRFKVVRPSR
jgi:hypothetical protein